MGMLRTLKFCKYLPALGWSPLVLTPSEGTHIYKCDAAEGSLPGVKVLRTGYFDVPTQMKSIIGFKPETPVTEQAGLFRGNESPLSRVSRKSLQMVKNIMLFPDSRIGWYRSAVREGLAAIERYHPDVIYSTSPPVTGHLVARRLKKLTGVPWVAELRDLWSDNHQAADSRWRNLLESRMEKRTLSQADGIVTVTDMFADMLRHKVESVNGNQVVIPNGFDPGDYPGMPPQKQEKFTLSHMGDLYGLSRDPAPIFNALRNLTARGRIDPGQVRLNFYGLPEGSPGRQKLRRLADSSGLGEATHISGAVSYRDSLVLQQSSTILLVIEVLTERGRGVIPGKIFEHLGAGRPSLALVPRAGEVDRLLRRTGGGHAFDPREDWNAFEDQLAEWFSEWSRTGTVAFQGDADTIAAMTRQNGAHKLALFLGRVISASPSVVDA